MYQSKILPFNSGICEIYSVEGRTIDTKLGKFNFHEETVGIRAYTEFQTNGIEIEKVISIPYNELIDMSRVVRINGSDNFYRISLIQVKDTLPKSLRLTLSKATINWKEKHDSL